MCTPIHSIEFPTGSGHGNIVDVGFLRCGRVVRFVPFLRLLATSSRPASSTVTMSNSSPLD